MSESMTPDYTPTGPEKARHDPTSKKCVDTYESATPHDNSIPAISTVIEGSSVTTGARCGALQNIDTVEVLPKSRNNPQTTRNRGKGSRKPIQPEEDRG